MSPLFVRRVGCVRNRRWGLRHVLMMAERELTFDTGECVLLTSALGNMLWNGYSTANTVFL